MAWWGYVLIVLAYLLGVSFIGRCMKEMTKR